MPSATIRPATSDELEPIKTIAVDAEMFTIDEVPFLDEMIGGAFDGSLEGHEWIVATDKTGAVVAAANYAPEPYSDRMWNLYFLAVSPSFQGEGLGGQLVSHVEQTLAALGDDVARVLVVETSSTDQYARTRDFYANQGYDKEATIRQFYGPEDNKVIFWKSLVEPKPD